ncbi:FecR family protein [Flavobacterium procerum]|uniref:FecR family protein n=1 Tax=Flavobacterium procerum TaxID=1455569 RepID=A0ABV6BXL1_9FLAO
MPDQLHNHIKHFLESKPSLKGEEMWNNWYDNPQLDDEDKVIILSSKAKLDRELRAIKKSEQLFFLNTKNWIAAASIILLMAGSYFFYQSTAAIAPKQYAAKLGEHAKITLSDGTTVLLNAGSVLKYPKTFNGDTREVSLTGEAFFDVAKDAKHPFIIHTAKMDTKVLGTSFNVQAYPDKNIQEVSVVTGKVNVKSTVTEENVNVTPGQKAVFKSKSNKLHAYTDVPINSISLWRKNIIVFEDTPLPEVIATISRDYNVVVELKNKNLNNLKISAYFKELPADQVVALVCNIINAGYNQKAGVFVIE